MIDARRSASAIVRMFPSTSRRLSGYWASTVAVEARILCEALDNAIAAANDSAVLEVHARLTAAGLRRAEAALSALRADRLAYSAITPPHIRGPLRFRSMSARQWKDIFHVGTREAAPLDEPGPCLVHIGTHRR